MADDLGFEKTLLSRLAYDGHFLKIRRDEVELPNGVSATREYILHPGAAMILPQRADGAVLIEKQFRYPLRKTFIEFPAGKIDAGEAPLVCAKRELLEETGLVASEWHYICPINNAIAYADEVIHLYLARGITETANTAREEGEQWLQTEWVQPSTLMQQMQAGKITDVKTMIALFWLDKITHSAWPLPPQLT